MRLIDADELKFEDITDGYMQGGGPLCVYKKDIDNTPTVEAIPIEFIEEYIEHQDAEEKKVLRMMWHAWELWGKENASEI